MVSISRLRKIYEADIGAVGVQKLSVEALAKWNSTHAPRHLLLQRAAATIPLVARLSFSFL